METKTNCQTTHTSHHDHPIETRGVSLKFLKWFTKYQVKPFFQRGGSQTDNWEIIEQLNQLDVADCIVRRNDCIVRRNRLIVLFVEMIVLRKRARIDNKVDQIQKEEAQIQKEEGQAKRLVSWFNKAKRNKDPMYLVTESGSRFVKVQSYNKMRSIKKVEDRKKIQNAV